MEAVIFIGVQGAGKTTFYREAFLQTHTHISLDVVRTRRREEQLVAECLKAGQPFVIDNTNPLASDRARYTAPARAAGFRVVAYFFQSSLRDAIERNNLRTMKQKVPVAAVASTHKKIQPPTTEEGFDAIYTVELTAGKFVARPRMDLAAKKESGA